MSCLAPFLRVTISPFSEVSDDTRSTRGARTQAPEYIRSDTFEFRAWGLITTAGFWTDVHHDANGAATWTTVSCGAKIWVLLTPKENVPTQLVQSYVEAIRMHQLDDPTVLQEHFHVTSILLEPGAAL